MNNDPQAIVQKVNDWLDNETVSVTKGKKANIELLKNNLDLSHLRVEQSGEQEKIIVIPVKYEFKKVKHVDNNKIPNLVLVVDKSGNIRKGNLVLYIPTKGEVLAKVPDNTFYHIFNTGKPECNGMFKFLSIWGSQSYQLEYKDGQISSMGQVIKGNNNSLVNYRTDCIDWFLVTTYYYADGTTSQTEEYVGRTCGNNECEDVECLDPGNGGGGGGGDHATAIAAFQSNYEINSASENEGSQLLSETPAIRTKQYPWVCGKALLIQARSLEYGTHKKINNEWQWETLTHQSVNITGVVIGGSVSVSSHSGQATLGIYNAIMNVNYSLHYNAIIPGFSPVNWSVTKSAASTWHVDY